MIVKPSVFVFQKAFDVFLRIVVGGWKSPLPVIGNLCAKQLTVPSCQNGGIRLVKLGDWDA